MRGTNPEWDLMGRTFLAYALAEMALRDAGERQRYLAEIDAIIADTTRLEREDGMTYFLLPYARSGEFRVQPPRSLFLDGEIALMIALRRLVEEREDYRPQLESRITAMVDRMNRGPGNAPFRRRTSDDGVRYNQLMVTCPLPVCAPGVFVWFVPPL
jgi:hypothetical protein